MTTIGLRIDVDTFRGTRDGVPQLLEILDRHGLRATFFFTVGPDNMGRHLWRLVRPGFFLKMIRSGAPALYGWDILLAGTLWPGKRIGRRLRDIIKATRDAGHEVGLHAWDHHAWQRRAGAWSVERLRQDIKLGTDTLGDILQERIRCSAAAGWRADQKVVEAKQVFQFDYNSDCRGQTAFAPLLTDGGRGTPQVPADLPTFDEVVGRDCGAREYFPNMLTRMEEQGGLVYTAHAEVEGIALAADFDRFLVQAKQSGIQFAPLAQLLPSDTAALADDRVVRGPLRGRDGWVGWQESSLRGQS